MKQLFVTLVAGVVLTAMPSGKADAQAEIITEIIKEAIMAVDLGVQKAQTQTVNLQDAQKVLENIMQEWHLTDITDWVQQQKDLYNEYYQELWEVKNAIAAYDKVVSMIDKQAQLIRDYQQAYSAMRQDSHFSAREVSYIGSVYSGILKQSVENLNQLYLVINALVTQMDDGERLHIIDGAAASIDQNYSDLHQFTQQNVLLSMQRAKDQSDLDQVKLLYGIQ